MHSSAKILSIADFNETRVKNQLGRVVLTSGGFDPIHPGHISCLLESKKLGNTLVVLVNGDSFLINKKGKPFQDLASRCFIVSCIKGVDYVIPYESKENMTVCEPLRQIKPDVFTKGGDRNDARNIPEWTVCKELNIELVMNVGAEKAWSSSNFLKLWEDFVKHKTIIISNLPKQVDSDEIKLLISKFGDVQELEIREFNDFSICIASMFNEIQADNALENLKNFTFNEKDLIIYKI